MNILWAVMILIGILYGGVNGTLQEVTDAAVSSSKEAVTLCITMAGVMSLWVGLMEIAKDAGIIDGLTRKLRPFLRFLFPNIPEKHPAQEHIAVNVIANFLGLGWAATPAGLKAMESLAELEKERRSGRVQMPEEFGGERRGSRVQMPEEFGGERRENGVRKSEVASKKRLKKPWAAGGMPLGIASNEMCTFLILNISSLQLIPVNIIAYRSQYGSVNPTAIVGPGILATAVSTGVAIVFCKMMDRRRRV